MLKEEEAICQCCPLYDFMIMHNIFGGIISSLPATLPAYVIGMIAIILYARSGAI
jgi:isocitrate/isopropylmalate dehydrogenase